MIWLPEACKDVEHLHDFLKQKSAVAAMRSMKTILEGARLLERAPEAGRPLGDDTGRRELSLPFGDGAYVLLYKRDALGTVIVVRVRHSGKNRDEEKDN